MSSEIILRDPPYWNDPDGDLDCRFENTINAPITSASPLINGAIYPGVYVLEITGAGATVTITVQGLDATKNPYNARVHSYTAGVHELEVLPGVDIVFAAGMTGGETAILAIGDFLDPILKTTDPRLNDGIILAGATGTQRQISYVNVGTDSGTDCWIDSLPRIWLRGTDANHSVFIAELTNHKNASYEKSAVTRTKEITFANYNGVPSPPTVDVYVKDLDSVPPDPAAVKTIQGAKLDGTTWYGTGVAEYIADKLPGTHIVFMDAPGDPTGTTLHIEIRPGYELEEVAPDVAGAPGAWAAPPLQMTESGQPAGVVTSSHQAKFWRRSVLPAGEQPGTHRLINWRARSKTI